jgi:hypothetical protein
VLEHDAGVARAAIVNSCSRSDRKAARTRRAVVIQPNSTRIMMMMTTLEAVPKVSYMRLPIPERGSRRMADSTSRIGRPGSVSMKSIRRLMTMSRSSWKEVTAPRQAATPTMATAAARPSAESSAFVFHSPASPDWTGPPARAQATRNTR